MIQHLQVINIDTFISPFKWDIPSLLAKETKTSTHLCNMDLFYKIILFVPECDPEKCESMEQIPNCREDQTLIAAHVEGTCCISYICGL